MAISGIVFPVDENAPDVVGSTNIPKIQENVPEEHRELFEMADRGGLSEPTEFCYAVTTLAVQCYTAISENDEIMKKLLK